MELIDKAGRCVARLYTVVCTGIVLFRYFVRRSDHVNQATHYFESRLQSFANREC
jgi:hypothetical protein